MIYSGEIIINKARIDGTFEEVDFFLNAGYAHVSDVYKNFEAQIVEYIKKFGDVLNGFHAEDKTIFYFEMRIYKNFNHSDQTWLHKVHTKPTYPEYFKTPLELLEWLYRDNYKLYIKAQKTKAE